MVEEPAAQKDYLPQIVPPAHGSLSGFQERFNQLVEQIHTLRTQHETMQLERVRVQREIRPLVAQIVVKRAVLVQLLDHTYCLYVLPQKEQKKLSTLISALVEPLVAHYDVRELTKILHRHLLPHEQPPTPEPVALPGPQAQEPDLDWNNWEVAQAQLAQQLERERQVRQSQRSAKKKRKVQLLVGDQLKLDIMGTARTTRRLYIDLAKLLHPDREQDAQQRLRKEKAMKDVTVAYHQDDFFALLRLQMEFLQAQPLHQMPENQLLQYVQLLENQLTELKNEQKNLTGKKSNSFYAFLTGSPRQVDLKLRRVKRELREELQQVEAQLVYLQDPKAVKELLKLV